jgi:hypothetical protein
MRAESMKTSIHTTGRVLFSLAWIKTTVFFWFPENEQQWRKPVQKFKKWHFDTCCGATAVKHVNILRNLRTEVPIIIIIRKDLALFC